MQLPRVDQLTMRQRRFLVRLLRRGQIRTPRALARKTFDGLHEQGFVEQIPGEVAWWRLSTAGFALARDVAIEAHALVELEAHP